MAKFKNKLGLWIFRILGLVFFLVGAVLLFLTVSFMTDAQETTGRVTHVAVNYGDDSVTYKPTVEYRVGGRMYESESWLSSSSYDFDVGERVPVLYDPADPSRIRLNYFMELWGFPLIFGGVGAVMVFVSMITARRMHRRNTGAVPTARKQIEPTSMETEPEQTDRYVRLPWRESAEDHARETNYEPTVRRNR